MKVEPLKYSQLGYKTLMQKRVRKVLLVCSSYDAFVIEEDGLIEEQIFNEYASLHLRHPPYFDIVNTADDAFERLENQDIDLVITMRSLIGMDLFDFAKKVKKNYENTPLVILTPFSRDVYIQMQKENLKHVDYLFSWLGNADIMLAIIKQVEDLHNAEHDIEQGVQAILLVEDSIRYYSSFLSSMYRLCFEHTKDLEVETLNEHQKMLRKRGRPKILHAADYETAVGYIEKYNTNILGVISDISFPRKGVHTKNAGIELAKFILNQDSHIPILLQSSDIENKKYADELNLNFHLKKSPKFLHNMRSFMKRYMAFGDFVFVDPETKEELQRVDNLKTLKKAINSVPAASLEYHLERNHISKWLNARALFGLGKFLQQYKIKDFENLHKTRQFVTQAIDQFRQKEGRGIIAKFNENSYDQCVRFARIGNTTIGGKARGLSFIDKKIANHYVLSNFGDVEVSVPQTVVLATSVFDKFMNNNNLLDFALSEVSDEEILDRFINSEFPTEHISEIIKFLEDIKKPIAVRSSSLLEDSHYQPFAGVYSTYMVPFSSDFDATVKMVIKAIKCVYASVYFNESKAYMTATHNVIDEEKMGVVLQEICGTNYGDRFYPIISGVARSINFYPIASEKTEDGVVDLAFGLGKQIVEGETTLHFSPGASNKILQLLNPKTTLQSTQKTFYAIDMTKTDFELTTDDSVTLKKFNLDEAQKDNSLDVVTSVYDFSTDTINDGTHYTGKKLLTFNNILKYKKFPLVDVIRKILQIGEHEIGHPVEIEFAVDFDFKKSKKVDFKLLQIRPIMANTEVINIDLKKEDLQNSIITSENAMGNGTIDDVFDIIYVRTENYDSTNNPKIAEIIGNLNKKFVDEQKNYFLVGPGRWGSHDRWLGIPIKWSQISAARIIVESGLENYRIEPSQGTHFFHNLTSFSVGYLTINPFIDDGSYNLDFLNNREAVYEDQYVRHVRFEKPIVAKIDGKRKIAVIMKPEK